MRKSPNRHLVPSQSQCCEARVILIVAFCVAFATSCTIAIHGKDNFKSQATKYEASFDKNYQDIFKCFTDSVVNTGYSQIYSDLGFAEWSSTPGGTYIVLAEFTQTSEKGTRVALWGIEGGDPYSRPGPYWDVVEACGT